MLNFDRYGFLKPNSEIACELVDFEEHFVNAFESKTRRQIFEHYKTFSDEIKRITHSSFLHQWINGSFVSKKINPKDIDFVTFIEESVFIKYQNEIQHLLNSKNWYLLGVDTYFVIIRKENNKFYFRYQSDRAYWLQQFTKVRATTKRNETRKKGFIELNY